MHRRLLTSQAVKGLLQNPSRRCSNSRKATLISTPHPTRHYSSSYLVGSSSSKLATPINGDSKSTYLDGDVSAGIKEHQPEATSDNASTINNTLLSNMIQGSYAIFIDAQNIPAKHCELAQQHIKSSISSQHNVLPSIKRIYGDVTLLKKEERAQFIVDHGFHIPYRYPDDANPNLHNIDVLMVMDVTESLYKNPHIKTYILMTGDGDFAPIVHKLREAGKIAMVYGQAKQTSDALANAAHCYVNTTELLAVEEERILALREEEERREQERILTEKRLLVEEEQKRKEEEDMKLFMKLAAEKQVEQERKEKEIAQKQKQKMIDKEEQRAADDLRQVSEGWQHYITGLLSDIFTNPAGSKSSTAESKEKVVESGNTSDNERAELNAQQLEDAEEMTANIISGSGKPMRYEFKYLIVDAGKKPTDHDKELILDIIRQLDFANEDGWINISVLGQRRLIKHKQYGYDKLSNLLDDLPGIEFKTEGVQKYVRLVGKDTLAVPTQKILTDHDKSMILGIIRQQADPSQATSWLNPSHLGNEINHKQYGYDKLLALLKDLPELEFKPNPYHGHYIRLRQEK